MAAEGGSERAGWVRSSGKREEWKCKRTDYSRREPRGPRGARILGACAAGVGTRAHVQTVSPLSLSFHSPSPSPRSFPPAFSLAYRRCSSLLSTRVARVLSLQGPIRLSLSLSLSPRVPLLASGRGSPITAERARSKAPRARSYSFRGAQYLGDR